MATRLHNVVSLLAAWLLIPFLLPVALWTGKVRITVIPKK